MIRSGTRFMVQADMMIGEQTLAGRVESSQLLFDLATAGCVAWPVSGLCLVTDSIAPASKQIARIDTISIEFPVFSDGRGFTLGRCLRTEIGFTGALIALGHIIPDQVIFLFRCGFSHAAIKPEQLAQWQTALNAITIYYQHMPASARSRQAKTH